MIQRFLQVSENVLRGGAPSPRDVFHLHKLGVNHIISLDKDVADSIKNTCKLFNIKHTIIPITRNSVHKMMSLDYDKLFNGYTNFVHCFHGKDRTGVVIALYKIKKLNVPCNKVYNEAVKIGLGLGLDNHLKSLYKKIILSCNKDSNAASESVTDIARDQDWENPSVMKYESPLPWYDNIGQMRSELVYQYPIMDDDFQVKMQNGFSAVPAIGMGGTRFVGMGPTQNINVLEY